MAPIAEIRSSAKLIMRTKEGQAMKRIALLVVAVATAAGVMASMLLTTGRADNETSPVFVTKIPPGYRDWRLISVAHEAGDYNDLRAMLGNADAMTAFRN